MTATLARAPRVASLPPLGTLGYLFCLLFALVAPVLTQGWRAVAAGVVAMALAAVFYPQGLGILTRRRLWLFVGTLVTSTALFVGPRDWALGAVTLSREGSWLGLQMALRAVNIVVAVTGFAANVSVSELAGLLERLGLKGLGFAFGVAFNMLPTIRATTTNAYQAIRLRGGFRRRRIKTVGMLLVTAITNSLRQADDIVTAAEARGFSTSRSHPLPLSKRRADWMLAGALLTLIILLLA